MKDPIICGEEEYLNANGASMCDLGEFALHRTPGGMSKRAKKAVMQRELEKSHEWQQKRDELRQEYKRCQKVL